MMLLHVMFRPGRSLGMVLREEGLYYVNNIASDCVYQNGVAECKNRHILETARVLLIVGRVPQTIWTIAIQYAIYLLNRQPFHVFFFKTPLQTLAAHVPICSHLNLTPRLFGRVAYVHLNKSHRTKLDPCAFRSVFVGFAPQQRSYRYYHPFNPSFYVTMDVTFMENNVFFLSDMPNHVLQGVNPVKEAHNWFEIEIRWKEAQNSALEFKPLSLAELSQVAVGSRLPIGRAEPNSLVELDISNPELESSDPLSCPYLFMLY
ncbi:hypothetical protein L3X38_038354 [Prunus dulcis]|uniref:Retroviral polymerase SH3-like domain-containing protein n=1 Tax=Prunus dulcis TaxID=3755 RepID=A0AAD4V7B1_PRUDU|nr:hypothetical protein L3X38_038354 [Prunus dulcis]